ncbi:MAG TPA: TglA family RiPP precursor [Kofleriaceae bacterium]|nr:TglA family RiPP precursor [Kofleriaceae bacterium]
MSVKVDSQDSINSNVDSTSGSAPDAGAAATAKDQPAGADPSAQPAAPGSSAASFEDFDLDDVEVVESKVFA